MQRLADQAFDLQRRGQFKQAITFYDKAIIKTASVQLLDRRAECHVLLGNHEAALKDAKASIQHASTDPVGYLRAGKVLQTMGKDEIAMQVMSTGLRRVKHAGKAFEDLRTEHKTLANKLSPDKSIDPLTMLPRELALMVLSYLNFHRVVGAMRVSKGWSRFIASCPELWQHLDLITVPPGSTKVRTAAVKRYVNIARRSATRLSIDNMFDFEVSLKLILQQCSIVDIVLGPSIPSLGDEFARMVVKHCPRLRNFSVRPSASSRSAHIICTIMSACAQTVEELELGPAYITPDFSVLEFPKLRLLSISTTPYNVLNRGLVPLPQMPNIESLKLRGPLEAQLYLSSQLKTFEKLSHLSVMLTIDSLKEIELPSSIRGLEVSIAHDNVAHYDDVHHSLELPLLQVLHVQHWQGTFDTFQEMFLEGGDAAQHRHDSDAGTDIASGPGSCALEPLTQLMLSHCDFQYNHSADLGLLLTHDRLKSIESLVIFRISPWDDDHLELVAKHMSKLRRLVVGYVNVTGVGVKAILDGFPHLQSFEVSNCRLAPDAVAWARAKGVYVNNRTDKAYM